MIAVLVTVLATAALVPLARRRGHVDLVGPGESDRKPSRSPIPLVGGLGILTGLLAGSGLLFDLNWGADLAPRMVVAAVAATSLGLVDDRLPGGLAPPVKLFGQGLVSLVLVLGTGRGMPESLGLWALAVWSQNACNTFDNADGALVSVAGSGFLLAALAAPPTLMAAGARTVAGAILGFLPFNLPGASFPRGHEPKAYLGDSGSHLIGILIAAEPRAWGILTLPSLDLVRLSIERLRRGSRPWIGDREHLAHLLARRGHAAGSICVILVLCSIPVALAVALAAGPAWLLTGLLGTVAGFCVLWVYARGACPGAGRTR